MLDRYPQMYKQGQLCLFYNHKVFWFWILNCFYHSMVVYYCMTWVYGEGSVIPTGQSADNWLFGETIYTMVLITITWKAAVVCDTFVKFTYVAIFGSIGFWLTGFPIYATIGPMAGISTELYGMIGPMFSAAAIWFSIILIPIFANIRDLTWKLYDLS